MRECHSRTDNRTVEPSEVVSQLWGRVQARDWVGVGGFVAGPIMIGLGNYGGVYMIIGGPIIVAMGWVVHPWGLQRAMNGQPLLPLRQ